MTVIRIFPISLLFLFFATAVHSQEIKVFQPLQRLLSYGEVIASQDNHLFVALELGPLNRADIAVLKLDEDGVPDEKFGKEGLFRLPSLFADRVFGMGFQSNNRIVLAGSRKIKNKTSLLAVGIDKHGDLDLEFGNKGKVVIEFEGNAEAHYLQILSDGRIVLSGFIERNGNTNFLLAMLTKDGQLDFSFAGKGWLEVDHGPNDRFYGLTLQGDKIVAAGLEKTSSNTHCVVASFLKGGTPDPDFGEQGFLKIKKEGFDTACSAIVNDGAGFWMTGYVKGSGQTKALLAYLDVFQEYSLTDMGQDFHLQMAHALAVDGPQRWVTGEGVRVKNGKQETGFFISDYFFPMLPSGLDLESASLAIDDDHRVWITGHVRGRLVVVRMKMNRDS